MKLISKILIFVIIISCDSNYKKDEILIREKISNIVNKFNYRLDVDVKKLSDNELKKSFIVSLTMKKPYKILSNDFKDMLHSYLAYRLYLETNFDGMIKFDFSYDIDKRRHSIVDYDKKKANRLPYNHNHKLKGLVEYCLTNFNEGYDVYFLGNLEKMPQILPNVLKKEEFRYILLQLTENEKPSIDNNADKLIFEYYSYIEYLLEKKVKMSKEQYEIRKRDTFHMNNFWKISKGRDIKEDSLFMNEIVELNTVVKAPTPHFRKNLSRGNSKKRKRK